MAQVFTSEWLDEDCARIARHFDSKVFWSASGRLISHLMKLATDWRWEVVDDGVVSAWEKRSISDVECAGIFSSLGPSYVWPVRFKFALDSAKSTIDTGHVKFGSCSLIPCKYMTEERKKLMADIKADHDYETDWMGVFRLENNKWYVELPENMVRN